MKWRRNKITPELVAEAFMEMQASTQAVFDIYNETFGVHATAINAHEERVVELEKAVASLLAERVE